MPQLHTYQGYKIAVRALPAEDAAPIVSVFDPRNKRGAAIHQTTSLDKAMRWIDAYIAGAHWAVELATL